MRRALAIAALLAAAAGAWWLISRGNGVPAAGEAADASAAAGASSAAAGLEVTTDPKRKSFTRTETLAGKAPPGEIRGVVDGPAGAPLGGLRVTARSRTPFRPAVTATTQPDGAFRLQGVEDQQVDVMLGEIPAGWSAASALASAGGGALRLRLERVKPKEPGKSATVAVTVLDPAGKPVVKARVKVQGRRDEKNFTMSDSDATDAQGVAHVEIADPEAHFWLGVDRPEDRDDVFDLEIDGWKPKDETLTLRRAVRLTGNLVDSEGNATSWGYVAWRTKDGEWTRAELHEDATFMSAQVPPGPMQVVGFDGWVDPPFPPDSRILDVDPSKGPIRVVAAAPSPGWVDVRLGPLEGSGVGLVTFGRVVDGRRVVDQESRWNGVDDGEVLLHRAVSRSSRYQIYARRNDGKIAFASDLTAEDTGHVRELAWTDPKTLGVVVQWAGPASRRGTPFIAQGLGLEGKPAPDENGVRWDRRSTGEATSEYVFEGVPDGTWTVTVACGDPEEFFAGSVDVPVGGIGRLDVRRTTFPVPRPR